MAIRSAPCRSHHGGRGKGIARRPAPQHLGPNTVAKAYRVLKGTLDSAVKVGLIRQTAATLAAAGGTSLRALMTRVGYAPVAAALRYQHVLDGQDAEIVEYLDASAMNRRRPPVTGTTVQKPIEKGA